MTLLVALLSTYRLSETNWDTLQSTYKYKTQTNRHTDTCLTSLLPQSLTPYQPAFQTGSQIQQIGAPHTSLTSPTVPPHLLSHPLCKGRIVLLSSGSSIHLEILDCPCLKSLTNYITSIVKTPQDWWLVITLKRNFYQDLELMFSCYVDTWWRFRS